MRKIRVSGRHRPTSSRLELLPLEIRDRDIVRAKQRADRSRSPGAVPRTRSAGPDRHGPGAEDRDA